MPTGSTPSEAGGAHAQRGKRQAELGLNLRRRARSPALRLALRGTPAAGELGAPGMHAYAGWNTLSVDQIGDWGFGRVR